MCFCVIVIWCNRLANGSLLLIGGHIELGLCHVFIEVIMYNKTPLVCFFITLCL
jgi:hypothetical protein